MEPALCQRELARADRATRAAPAEPVRGARALPHRTGRGELGIAPRECAAFLLAAPRAVWPGTALLRRGALPAGRRAKDDGAGARAVCIGAARLFPVASQGRAGP